jgi:hypothetical protein
LDLYKKQLELQKSSYKKIEASENFLKKNKIIKYINKLSKDILELKKISFKEVLKKIIREESNKYLEILDVNLKNIEDYITLYLSNEIIEFIENGKKKYNSFDAFKNSNPNFYEISIDTYKTMIDYTIKILDDNLEFINNLKEIHQVSSLALYPLTSKQISYTLLSVIIQIDNVDNDDEENNVNSRQNIGDEIADAIWNTLIYRYFIPVKKFDLIDIEEIWEAKIKQQIAQEMIDFLIKNKILEEYKDSQKEKNFKYLRLTDKFRNSLNQIEKDILKRVNVTFKPMVVKPIEWSDIDNGGFLKDKESSIEHSNLKIIKASTKKEKLSVKEKKGKIPKEILSAINAIQNTEFRINTEMLDIFNILSKKLKRNNKGIIDSNYHKKRKLKFEGVEKIEEILLYEMAKYKNSFDRILEIADEFKDFEKIYFVWNMDFRGRVYSVQSLLNPQAGDIAKSLLLFANKQKLTEEGIKWFKIHGANLYGEVDKELFEKRIEWVEQHEKDILNSANNYETESFWKKADEPFQFLAFCLEYKRFYQNKENFETSIPVAIDGSNNGLQHISTLLKDIKSAKEVNVLPNEDNKISDIYNIIAESVKKELQKEKEEFEKNKDKYILENGIYYEEVEKDILDDRMFAKEILDKLENLDVEMIGNKNISTALDLDEKQEEYIKKLEKLHKKQPTKLRMKKRLINELEDDIEDLEEDVKNGNVILKKNKYYKKIKKRVFVEESLISLIDDKIDRSFVKSAVMTDSYGASTKSKGNKLKEKMEKLNIIEDENILFKFSQYLAKKIDAIIDKEIKSSEKYKKWISSIAKEILKTENQIEWKTPLGFIVSQNEYKTKKQILSTNLGKITIHIYTDEIDKKKNKTAIAPNFIHSLDATHLFKTINSLKKKGLKDFITIHDSFATHANDVMTLSKTLREEFVDLYSKNVLEDFIDNVNNIYNLNLEKKIPYINKDTFTLKEILNSIYLFS